MASISGHIARQGNTLTSLSGHDPHLQGRNFPSYLAAVKRQPVTLAEVEAYRRVAAPRHDAPRRRVRPQPELFQALAALRAPKAVLAEEKVVRPAVETEYRPGAGKLTDKSSRLLTTAAVAGNVSKRRSFDMQGDQTASASSQIGVVK